MLTLVISVALVFPRMIIRGLIEGLENPRASISRETFPRMIIRGLIEGLVPIGAWNR